MNASAGSDHYYADIDFSSAGSSDLSSQQSQRFKSMLRTNSCVCRQSLDMFAARFVPFLYRKDKVINQPPFIPMNEPGVF